MHVNTTTARAEALVHQPHRPQFVAMAESQPQYYSEDQTRFAKHRERIGQEEAGMRRRANSPIEAPCRLKRARQGPYEPGGSWVQARHLPLALLEPPAGR